MILKQGKETPPWRLGGNVGPANDLLQETTEILPKRVYHYGVTQSL